MGRETGQEGDVCVWQVEGERICGDEREMGREERRRKVGVGRREERKGPYWKDGENREGM